MSLFTLFLGMMGRVIWVFHCGAFPHFEFLPLLYSLLQLNIPSGCAVMWIFSCESGGFVFQHPWLFALQVFNVYAQQEKQGKFHFCHFTGKHFEVSHALHFGNIPKTWCSELQEHNKNMYSSFCLRTPCVMSSWSVPEIVHRSKIQDVVPEPALAFDHCASPMPSCELGITAAPWLNNLTFLIPLKIQFHVKLESPVGSFQPWSISWWCTTAGPAVLEELKIPENCLKQLQQVHAALEILILGAECDKSWCGLGSGMMGKGISRCQQQELLCLSFQRKLDLCEAEILGL